MQPIANYYEDKEEFVNKISDIELKLKLLSIMIAVVFFSILLHW